MSSDDAFSILQDTDRFEIRRQLGAGSFGVVAEAYDKERNAVVAVKTLHTLDPLTLYNFKREFRAVADITHPNLVGLHELMTDGTRWFFTMDLVEGVSFLEYVRRGTADSTTAASPLDPRDLEPGGKPPTAADLERLRSALRQLADALSALHAAGKLHRDIKPPNVMVTREGRLVLLDFGLATEVAGDDHREMIVGTAAYMAPEQAAARDLTEASDWYAVGIMMWQALTGELPFTGSLSEILHEKQRREVGSPSARVRGVPEDLDALCVALTRIKPEDRPLGPAIVQRLAPPSVEEPVGGVSGQVMAGRFLSSQPSTALVGRSAQIGALGGAFARVRNGSPIAVYLHGASGMGKSVVVKSFLAAASLTPDVVCLAGRCYERESVPYKALDSLIDSLCRYLLTLPRAEVGALLPRNVHAITRIFPVLLRVEAVAAAPRRGLDAPDPIELKRRAVVALKDLLARLADRKRIILYIDDLQWGDVDGVHLLADLLRPPDPPALLLIACYRSEDVAKSLALQALLDPKVKADMGEVRDVAVGPLAPGEAVELARALLGRRGAGEGDAPPADAEAEAIGRESGGNPFFAAELVRYAREGLGASANAGSPAAVTLDEVIRARFVRLPEPARRLLEVVAVAGRPVEQATAIRAAGLDSTNDRLALAQLRSGRLIRSRGAGKHDEIESYHNRIREAVTATMPADARRERHRALARSLAHGGRADAEALVFHYQAAGDLHIAADHAIVAAAQANEALAFDRAAEFYRLALELKAEEGPRRRAVVTRLGQALANAGRGAESARAYLEAVPGSTAAEALELQRLAAEQLLRSGHIDEGTKVVRTVLEAIHMKLAETPFRALLSLLYHRARVRLRGLGFKERDTSQVAAEELMRIDACWSVSAGLSIVDTIRGADFQARNLLLSLRAGEPYRIARALAMEAGYASAGGAPARARTQRVLERARSILERIDNQHAHGLFELSSGIAAYCVDGRWRAAFEATSRAEGIFRDLCRGAAWEIATAQYFSLWSLFYLGELAQLVASLRVAMNEADERGDLYAGTSLRVRLGGIVWLMADDPEACKRESDASMSAWSKRGFHIQHADHAFARSELELYSGSAPAAWERVTRHWREIDNALVFRIQHIRVIWLQLRARCALAMAAAGEVPADFLARAEKDAAAIAREGLAWATAMAELLRAGAAGVRGQREAALAHLAVSASGFDAMEMKLYAAVARRRRGEAQGGAEGRDLIAAADAWMEGQGIRNPARMMGMLAPGFATPPAR